MQRVLGSAAALAVVAAVVPAVASSGPGSPASSAQHCASSVVAHRAGGHVLKPQPRRLASACGRTTGFPGAESHIVVRKDGSVVYTPAVLPSGLLGTGTAPVDENSHSQSNASPAGLAFSRDGGRRWSGVTPAGAKGEPTRHTGSNDPGAGRKVF